MSRGLGRETTPAGLDKQRRKWLPAQRFCVSADVIPAECSSDSTPGIDWDEAVDFAFASIELDERTRRIVVSVLEELVERRRNLSVNTGRLTDQPEPQVAPAWDRRLVETERVLSIAGQALGAKQVRAGSIVDQAHHPTPVQ